MVNVHLAAARTRVATTEKSVWTKPVCPAVTTVTGTVVLVERCATVTPLHVWIVSMIGIVVSRSAAMPIVANVSLHARSTGIVRGGLYAVVADV